MSGLSCLSKLLYPSRLCAIVAALPLAALCATAGYAQTGGLISVAPNGPLPAIGPMGGGSGLAKWEPPDGTVLHGASFPYAGSDSALRAEIAQFKQLSGKRTAVVTWYASTYEMGKMSSWRNGYAQDLQRVKNAGDVSLIKFSVQDYAYDQTHKIANLKMIAMGVYDAYFQEAADTCRDFGDPIFISINHEMNGTWYPYSQAYPNSGVTAADYVASWRHIVDIFRKRGANNVAWVWSPNVPDVGPVSFTSYYPGDNYVDWVGVSLYSGNPITNLDTIYRTYASRKPIFITEWATGVEKNRYFEGFPGESVWVNDFFTELQARYPRVKAISWFQQNKEDGDYLLQRVPAQEQVYKTDIANPRYLEQPMGLSKGSASGVQQVYTQVVPREIILNEAVPVQQVPVQQVPIENPLVVPPPRQRIRLQIVPMGQ